MKIAMLIDRLAVGGGPEYIRLVAGHLPEHRFTVLSLDGGTLPALRALDNVEIARWPGRAALKSAHFDLIHCHHLRSLLRLFPPCGIPVVNTIHGIHCRNFEFDGPAGAIKKTLRTKLEHFLLSRVDVNIALTADDAEWLERSYHLRNLAIIPNGVDVNTLCR